MSREVTMIRFVDACHRMGITKRTGYNQLNENRFALPVVKRGNRTYVNSEDLDQYIKLMFSPPPEPVRRGRPRNQPLPV